ncbi:MAG: hypothetical protein QHJ73_06980 [Armatimonadota bacterium]|nr:hypothetical protein [Armatimonadota bacterium]
MNVMIVSDGAGDFYFLQRFLEELGAQVIYSPSLDEDKVITRKIDAVVHAWSGFLSDVERVQIQNILETSPPPVVALFAQPQDVNALRRTFPGQLVAEMKALEEPYARRTAEALMREVQKRRGTAAMKA